MTSSVAVRRLRRNSAGMPQCPQTRQTAADRAIERIEHVRHRAQRTVEREIKRGKLTRLEVIRLRKGTLHRQVARGAKLTRLQCQLLKLYKARLKAAQRRVSAA